MYTSIEYYTIIIIRCPGKDINFVALPLNSIYMLLFYLIHEITAKDNTVFRLNQRAQYRNNYLISPFPVRTTTTSLLCSFVVIKFNRIGLHILGPRNLDCSSYTYCSRDGTGNCG